MIQYSKKIGVFGGTFDPPHIGHLIVAQTALCELKLDKVLFIPCGNPPHKKGRAVSNSQHRVEMVKKAIASNNRFELCDIETTSIDYSYTANTLKYLHKCFDDTELIFIVGADSLAYMKDWWCPDEIFSLCTVAVAVRADTPKEKLATEIQICRERFNAKIHMLNMPIINISASEIRKSTDLERFKYMLPQEVADYIISNNLYNDKAALI